RDILAEIADDDVAPPRDRPRICLLLSGDDLEQRRLTRAVRTDDRDPSPGGDLERDVAEQVLGTEGLRDAGERDQGHGPGMVAACLYAGSPGGAHRHYPSQDPAPLRAGVLLRAPASSTRRRAAIP